MKNPFLRSYYVAMHTHVVYLITVPVRSFNASLNASIEVMIARRPSRFSMKETEAWNFGSIL